jgi:hypothetical protein
MLGRLPAWRFGICLTDWQPMPPVRAVAALSLVIVFVAPIATFPQAHTTKLSMIRGLAAFWFFAAAPAPAHSSSASTRRWASTHGIAPTGIGLPLSTDLTAADHHVYLHCGGLRWQDNAR